MAVIQDSTPALTLLAGDRALARIRHRGLTPGDVTLLPGAAGGPKALGIQGLDLALFGDWLPRVPRQRSLIGSSIGSWRFASACLPDPVAGLKRLGELYTCQRFTRGSSRQQVAAQCEAMLEELLDGQGPQVLENPHYSLQVMVARSRGPIGSDHTLALALGLGSVILANALHRPWLRFFYERVLLHDPRQAPSMGPFEDMPGRLGALTTENLHQALLASGSIPGVMSAVAAIAGIPGQNFRDGGMVDYHLDLPYQCDDGVVLYPHFTDRIVPGWFDKPWRWRRGDRERLKDVLLVAPSAHYLTRLPTGKLPDRRDFVLYEGRDQERERDWRICMGESERLGDGFLELTETGRLADAVKPLFS
ncbi:MAG: patatin-like phospholipase family protein [Halomonadaceae bacterium]|nr:MAG: patatin-like phospholipase family protein [Halomonadaceae bacterium]